MGRENGPCVGFCRSPGCGVAVVVVGWLGEGGTVGTVGTVALGNGGLSAVSPRLPLWFAEVEVVVGRPLLHWLLLGRGACLEFVLSRGEVDLRKSLRIPLRQGIWGKGEPSPGSHVGSPLVSPGLRAAAGGGSAVAAVPVTRPQVSADCRGGQVGSCPPCW